MADAYTNVNHNNVMGNGGSDGPFSPDFIPMLTAAAHAATTSTDRQEREAGAERLRFLSTFDNWESTLKRLLPYCQDNCLRFMVCKAIYFMVTNELGPQERAEMKLYVLRYISDRRSHNEVLPIFVQRELYLIYASALFSNWKIAIISDANNSSFNTVASTNGGSSGPEGSNENPPALSAFELVGQMVEELSSYLTQEEVLDALREVVVYFSQHIAKAAIPSLRNAFINTVLPYFFETAAQALSSTPQRATEVCCTVLECMGPLTNSGGLINVKFTSEGTIHVLRWMDGWSTSLTIAVDHCRAYLCADPTGPLASLTGRLVQLCSRVDSPHEAFMRQGRAVLSEKLLQVSTDLLNVCQAPAAGNSQGVLSELLLLAAEIFVNVFERCGDEVILYTTRHFPQVIQTWADATQYVLGRFADDEDDLRQLLMHLFCLFGDRLLPRRIRRRGGTAASGSGELDMMRMMETGYYGNLTLPSVPPSYEELEGPLGKENGQQLSQLVQAVFTAYLSAVIDKAHLREDSDELRFEAGVNLHNERTLYPLAEMLYCDKLDFLPMMTARLSAAIDEFQVCAGARESALRSGGMNLPTPDGTGRIMQLIASLDPAQMQGFLFTNADNSPAGLLANFHQSPLSLFLMRVCLSRLSVLISIFAIAIQKNTHSTSDEVLVLISTFARKLLSEDDSLTNEMLQTLSLFDSAFDDNANSGSGTPSPTLHIGILRSLFFFCNCVYESNFDRRPEFVDIMLDLLRFVYLFHSEEAPLMVDANVLFKRVVTEGPTTAQLLSSDKLTALVQAVSEDTITALRLPPPTQPPLPPAARSDFFTAFTAFVETRFYAGYRVGPIMHTLLARALHPQRLMQGFATASLEEAIAITHGIQQPDTLLVALDAVMANRTLLIDQVMRKDAEPAALVIRLLSALCVLARSLLSEDPASTTQWDLSSLLLNAVISFFSLISTAAQPPMTGMESGGGGALLPGVVATKFYAFHVDVVEAEVVYDLADILQTLCTASWSNLDVVAYYERQTVERFFCGVVQLLTSVSPPLLMSSDRGKRTVFEVMITALTTSGQIFESLHLLLMRQQVWQHILDYLTRCLQYSYVPEVITAILLVVRHDATCMEKGSVNSNYVGIGERQLSAAFHEVLVLVAITPYLEIRQLSHVFDILRICFTRAKVPCTDRVKELLDYCSAYHRVRLRTIWSMLMNGEPDMLERYVSVFGQSSKVAMLSAW